MDAQLEKLINSIPCGGYAHIEKRRVRRLPNGKYSVGDQVTTSAYEVISIVSETYHLYPMYTALSPVKKIKRIKSLDRN